jgi:hypothetical protein
VIVDLEARLFVPDLLEFGETLIGTTVERTLELTNRGGLPAEGKLELDPPWRLAGPADYQIAAGETGRFQVLFAPDAPGDFRSELRYSSQRDRTTAIHGLARAPIEIMPARVELRRAGNDPVRSGFVELTNHTAEPQTVALRASERLSFTREASLAPGEKIVLPIQTSPTDTKALDEELEIEGGGISQKVPVLGAALGPVLQVSPAAVNFGTIGVGKATAVHVRLTNAGGIDDQARVEVSAPFTVDKASVPIAAGTAQTVGVSILATTAGAVEGSLQIVSAGGSAAIPLYADARTAPARPEADRKLTAGPAARGNTASAPSKESEDEAPARSATNVPGLDPPFIPVPHKIVRTTPTECEIAWKAKEDRPSRFLAETRLLALDEKRDLKITWLEHAALKVEQREDRFHGTLQNLQPGTFYTARIRPILADGSRGGPLFEVSLRTPAERSLLPRPTRSRCSCPPLSSASVLLGWQSGGRAATRACENFHKFPLRHFSAQPYRPQLIIRILPSCL